jgi:pimeloyl-ACP methyl ester carboxylesterase
MLRRLDGAAARRSGGDALPLANFDRRFLDVNGIRIELQTSGMGRPIVFLHSEDGLFGVDEALGRLASLGQVIVPSHPGFGNSELSPSISTVDDLSYFYLDLLDALALEETVLIGASLGGWIAAQTAVKCSQRIGKLILVDSVGIKVSDRAVRDILDVHALDSQELAKATYFDHLKHKPNFAEFSDDDALIVARNRETFTFLVWRPYMHDPKLFGRLHRIKNPTLVLWGDHDQIVSPQYGKAMSNQILSSEFRLIKNAGHYPFVEQPQAFQSEVAAFIAA